jgi:hypothetical protein
MLIWKTVASVVVDMVGGLEYFWVMFWSDLSWGCASLEGLVC